MKATSTMVLTLLLVSTFPAAAQAPAPTEPPPVEMKLAEALRLALENNLDLAIQRQNPLVAEQNVTVQDAGFDGVVSAFAAHQADKIAEFFDPDRNIFIPTQDTYSDVVGASWSKNLRFGGDYSIGLSTSRSTGSGSFQSQYRSQLELSWNLPLFAGRGGEVNQLQLLIARSDLEISRGELRTRAERTVREVESAYWTLAGARAAVDVARKSLALAGDLLTLNRKKVEVGTLAPIEITQAEAGVASRQEGVIVAETNLRDAEDEFRRLLGVPPGDPLWEKRIVPLDAPAQTSPPVDVEGAIATALASRQEVVVGRKNLEQTQLRERVSANALRPNLGLSLNATPIGQALDEPEEALTNVADLDNYGWSLALNYRYPVGNRAAKASAKIAELQVGTAELQLRNVEQDIRVQVRTAARAVSSGLERVNAAKSNVELQRKKLEAEQKKFENGMSTSFEVLTFQTDLAEAELSLIRAMLDYNVALAALQAATGSILESRGLAFQP